MASYEMLERESYSLNRIKMKLKIEDKKIMREYEKFVLFLFLKKFRDVLSKEKKKILFFGMLFFGEENMDLYYKNETLFVRVVYDITLETIANLEKKLFPILDDYGIEKIVVSVLGNTNKDLLTRFKRNYNKKYSGYMLIK